MPAWQGLWTREANNPSGYSLLINKSPIRNRIKRVVNREGFRQAQALFNALIGAATGGTATATHKRVGQPTDLSVGSSGGARGIDTVTDINRVTTAADVTALKEMVYGVKTRPITYPKDLSGNGGPSF